ncbi:vWA domain-containing protein [Methanococcoides seepicolus]|uniref:VWA domain-containing protein n=1 Tax=Methanococcoides seepicolus TaxID=2828780 RepID=A0A9E4ZFD6_9EURY|nr:vWA domain-containing protein [Methanococcoides seepicolus]MCM1985909.1 VWA domain-containing protein [Methanococcoides seepicolus]
MTFTFEQPLMFALILPVIAGGLFLLREGARRPIIISRMIVLSLLVIALASPSAIVSDVTSDENPNLVVISDETASMSLFEEGVGMNVYESLTANTPTTFIRLTGESTSLGDVIEQYSTGDNQIVLVSDGNSNFGKDIDESLQYAKEMGTIVYSVEPELKKNDISVQILGEKTVVRNNEIQFDILVSQAGNDEIKYSLDAYAGEKPIRKGTFTQNTRTRTITTSSFELDKLGAHEIRVELTQLSEDADAINNKYYKSIYVVPKPKIQFVTDDINAPLAKILFDLYSPTYKNGLEGINNKKTVVLDNQIISSLSDSDIEMLKEYVTEGNGLVVVGGERAYNNGDYLDSPLEELLPVISKATEWTGGETVVFLIDTSGSSSGGSIDVGGSEYNPLTHTKDEEEDVSYQILNKVRASTYELIDYDELWDANAGIVIFSSEATVKSEMISLNSVENRETLKTILSELTSGSGTDLDAGLSVTKDLLSKETGDKLVIILSDGQIANSYEQSVAIAKEMKEEQSITFLFIHHVDFEPSRNYAQMFIEEVEGEATTSNYILTESYIGNIESSTILQPEPIDETTNNTEETGSFKLVELNPNHFITRDFDIEGNITGYNDVTPKPGADRIIITSTGKPVVTTWRYGLGRVAAITTDNGEGGEARWASEIYNRETNNSKLISSTMNWAIGNPQVEEGTVVEAEDTWFGTPATLYITHYDGNTPVLRYKGNTLELAVTGRNTYETTIDPKNIGFHDVSGYPIAVNYAIEYRDVGMNEDLPVFIKENSGKTYTENEALALLLKDARGNSLKSVQRSESQKLFFLIAALLLFLGEIAVRRIREIRESKKGD